MGSMNPARIALRTVYGAVDYLPSIGIFTITAKSLSETPSHDIGDAFRNIWQNYRGRAVLQIAYLGLHIATS